MEKNRLMVNARDDEHARTIAKAMETILNTEDSSYSWTIWVEHLQDQQYNLLINRVRKGEFEWQ